LCTACDACKQSRHALAVSGLQTYLVNNHMRKLHWGSRRRPQTEVGDMGIGVRCRRKRGRRPPPARARKDATAAVSAGGGCQCERRKRPQLSRAPEEAAAANSGSRLLRQARLTGLLEADGGREGGVATQEADRRRRDRRPATGGGATGGRRPAAARPCRPTGSGASGRCRAGQGGGRLAGRRAASPAQHVGGEEDVINNLKILGIKIQIKNVMWHAWL
jgi:hypothetical protein